MTSSVRPLPLSTSCAPAVREFMSPHPIAVGPDALLAHVWQTMNERRIRHVPVLGPSGDLIGLVTERDVLVLGQGGLDQRTGHVMRAEIETVGPDHCVGAAARFMLRTKKGCLPVVDDAGSLLGILTEADFVRSFVRGAVTCACEPVHFLGGVDAPDGE